MVSFHKVLVDVLLIINVVCFIFRFKRGTACQLFATEGPEKTQTHE